MRSSQKTNYRPFWSFAFMLMLVLGVWGCSNDDNTGDGGSIVDAGLTTDGFFLPEVVDSAVISDGGSVDRLGYLEGCSDNEDCQSGWCVASPMGYVCSRICFERNDCEEGWSCLVVSNTPPDVTSICLPPTNRLCNLCTVDRDCPGGHCYQLDGESVCGLDCGDDVQCPENYTCSDVDGRQTCLPDTSSCSCNDDNSGAVRFCERRNDFGACVGREVCDPTIGWSGCTASEPLAETCNGLDDDCNGFNDDIFGLGELCEREADVSGERISCAGIIVCSDDSPQPICTATDPMEETCNFLDDDCDGETDEGFDENGEICVVGTGLCQKIGVFECSPEGDVVQCSVEPASPSNELCDGLDNDCDEQVDETFPELNNICTVGDGACQAAGVWKCSDDFESRVCSATAREASNEFCDSIDNDCDDNIDEDFPNILEPCAQGVGACRRQGFIFCSEDTLGTACTAEAGIPRVEICNGLDDDCDGNIDEGYAGVNQPCFAGEGVCRTPGITVCTGDGVGITCNAVAGEPSEEICNGLDDNCDGEIDEAFEALGRPCESDALGICKSRGVYECALDGLTTQCDAPIIAPAEVELCNGLDDNCDGEIDEDFPLIDSICTSGAGLCQRSGRFVCNDAEDDTVCTATAGQPSQEVCNGLDDNCDGNIDEGFDGVNQPCFSGEGTCRAAGITVCSADGANVECNAVALAPTAEICNGLDDNCDGNIDEGFDGVNLPCFAGEGTCRTAGLTICSDDGASVHCNAVANPPSAERCNGLDDNCDGTIDEGFDGLNQPCIRGEGICRATGITVCNVDGLDTECSAQVGQPGDELCNGLDDNCNGQTDETFPEIGSLCDSGGVGICQSRGVFECAADGTQAVCNATVIAPDNAESCNGLDDNCNGRTDESFPRLNSICTVGEGACERAGIYVCDPSGVSDVCNATAGEPRQELCNRLDDNCNGRVDEDFPTVGNTCESGLGLCRRSGVINCDSDNPAGDPVCDAEAVVPQNPGVDACDYQDDDCDGNVDESFLDQNGRYSQVGNCGACGTDCRALWDPNPAAFGVAPTCALIANTTQCSFTCLPGFIDADGVASNGCELAPDEGAIYVQSPSNGGIDDVNCGLVQAPCATITYALERAQLDTKQRVRVAEGSYRETVTLVSGVDLIGGHQRVNWERNPDLYASVIFGADSDDVHKAAVKALNIIEPTTFDGFSINAEPVLFEGNSYGIYIVDSDAHLNVSNNRVLAANGGIGMDGVSGTSGSPGDNGDSGGPSFTINKPDPCTTAIRNAGASGGQNSCAGANTSGGNGGGARCPAAGRQEESGQNGGTTAGGSGGTGAFGVSIELNSSDDLVCSLNGSLDAFPGTAGSSGNDGGGGGGAIASLRTAGNHWQGNSGNNGNSGVSGGGGGGGGAAAGLDIDLPRFYPDRGNVTIGASGGGGGAGGCAGQRGNGGQSGGGSFAVFIVFQALTPVDVTDFPKLTNNVLWRGLGGRGGSGGKGGAGGEGGLGGLGGQTGNNVFYDFCSLSAGEGGTGGRGGHAGGGGGGQGGNSFDIFIVGSNNVVLEYQALNEFPVGEDEVTSGVGGEGGNSSNTLTGEGDAGTDGLSGQVGQLP
jgi:hypothetical protein